MKVCTMSYSQIYQSRPKDQIKSNGLQRQGHLQMWEKV